MSSLERTGWRDMEISARHRKWGFNCPAVDLDFLMVEYNAALPVALVEYKHHRARSVDLRHATYRALRNLADMAGLPFLIAFYWPESWAFHVIPVNDAARHVYHDGCDLSEKRFVESLYHLRKLKLQEHVLAHLNTEEPPIMDSRPTITRWEEAA